MQQERSRGKDGAGSRWKEKRRELDGRTFKYLTLPLLRCGVTHSALYVYMCVNQGIYMYVLVLSVHGLDQRVVVLLAECVHVIV